MSRLQTMEKVVLKILEQSKTAREDDYVLMWLVCDELAPEITNKPFSEVMYMHKILGLPNWETVTRCRRKIQEKRPDLLSPEKAKKRREEEEAYKEYART